MARNVPIATRRTSPPRGKSEESGLNRGVYSGEKREFVNAIEKFKKEHRKPFPLWTDIFDIIIALGYRKGGVLPADHPDARDLADLRSEMDSRICDLATVEKKRSEQANEFAETERKLVDEIAETRRALRDEGLRTKEVIAENARIAHILIGIDEVCAEAEAVCGSVWAKRIREQLEQR